MKNLLKISTITLLVLLVFSCSNDNQENVSIENKLLDLFEKSSLDENVMLISSIDDTTINYKLEDGWEHGWSEKNQEIVNVNEVCHGNNLSFAKSLKKALDEGKCIKVYRENGGDYTAEEMSCN